MDIRLQQGEQMRFHLPALPQNFYNVLGFVSEDVKELAFSLNGGWPMELALGPACTNKEMVEPGFSRLAYPGEFNVDIPVDQLKQGENQFRFTAKDEGGQEFERKAALIFDPGKAWPLPDTVRWNQGTVHDNALVVDGQWKLEEGRLRTAATGYDRLVAVGDRNWTDYEAEAAVTIHDWERLGRGLGSHVALVTHFPGHADDGKESPDCRRPYHGWRTQGVMTSFYTDDGKGFRLRLWNGLELSEVTEPVFFILEQPHVIKTRAWVEGETGFYCSKAWPLGETEPEGWQLEGTSGPPGSLRGGLLLLAHYADASFGGVRLRPLAE